ncbi:MAG: hypothetical protein KGS49_08380 [Planctomycetes bacterium]|nr:hypothetical protein [Planctomycetota bacterium]
MIEPKFPMHQELDQFEQDLKSLTPKQYPDTLSVQAKTSYHDAGFVTKPDTLPVADNHPHRSPTANRTWIQIAMVSWVTGLAAGILLSAIWTRVMMEPVPLAKSNAIPQNITAAESRFPNTKSVLAPQPSALDQEDVLAAICRSIAINSDSDVVLRPIMQRNAFLVNAASLPSTSRIDQAELGSHPEAKEPDANDHNRMTSPASEFNSLRNLQGQRQLLKTLLEFENLNTI